MNFLGSSAMKSPAVTSAPPARIASGGTYAAATPTMSIPIGTNPKAERWFTLMTRESTWSGNREYSGGGEAPVEDACYCGTYHRGGLPREAYQRVGGGISRANDKKWDHASKGRVEEAFTDTKDDRHRSKECDRQVPGDIRNGKP